MIKAHTKEELGTKICPFFFKEVRMCTTNCMACREFYPRVEREDHSGAMQNMLRIAHDRGRSSADIKKSGVRMDPRLTLESEYICLRLVSAEAALTADWIGGDR